MEFTNDHAVHANLKVGIQAFFDRTHNWNAVVDESLKQEVRRQITEHGGLRIATTKGSGESTVVYLHESGNDESLRDALFVRRTFVLCSSMEDGLDSLAEEVENVDSDLVYSASDQLPDDADQAVFPGLDGKVEYVICTSFQRSMELIEESFARGAKLFAATAAASA
eukprot:CAMPEP_0119010970 /NCGR_PEP_ID=MMETSP1176-20130426/5368_1 /TAXON_ID=265551 /ORGANISM="Synedropsis recta cf, Strain CCMP1620" /LENGTH=166 /DNA_ID=CAMNT_0006963721 /DNA_START=50 /DNA_END=550 /DNA_ORIENTATION=-